MTAPPVLEFDQAGKVVRSWGAGEGYDWFNSEHGIYVDPKGFVWVAGNGTGDHHILKFTKDGKFVMKIGGVDVSKGSNDTSSVRQVGNHGSGRRRPTSCTSPTVTGIAA